MAAYTFITLVVMQPKGTHLPGCQNQCKQDYVESSLSYVSCKVLPMQDELARVLYPLFIHCYLELITKRATSEAHRLLTKQKQRFTSSGAQTAQIREQVCSLS